MKKQILLLFLSLITISVFGQQAALPAGAVPYGSQYYKAPDGSVWMGTTGKQFTKVTEKRMLDSLASAVTASLALKESLANKTTSLTDPNNTSYPTTEAVSAALALKQSVFVPNVSEFGAKGDGVTDDYPAFLAAQSTGKSFQLTAGKRYRLATPIQLNDNQDLYGNGATIVLNNNYGIKLGMYSLISNVRFVGSGKTTLKLGEIGIYIKKKAGFIIDKCVFDSLAYAGIYADSTVNFPGNSNTEYKTSMINANKFYNSRAGLVSGKRGEYLQIYGSTATLCDTAVVMGGGNNKLIGGDFISGAIGLYLKNDGVNDSHSVATGATFNHNTFNIKTDGVVYNYKFVGCQILAGQMDFLNSGDIEINSCIISPRSISLGISNSNSKLKIFNTMFMSSTPYTESGGGVHLFEKNTLSYNAVSVTPAQRAIDSVLYTLSTSTNSIALNNQPPSYYLNFTNLTNKPTTLSGYGISDAYTQTQINTGFHRLGSLAGGYVPAASGASLNLVTTNNTFYSTSSDSDRPVTSSVGFVTSYGRSSLFSAQTYIGASVSDDFWIRNNNNGTFGGWLQLASRAWAISQFAPISGNSGTYTPTVSTSSNMDSATPEQCQYTRVGNIVTVFGGIAVDVTNASSSSMVGLTLPIATSLVNTYDLTGFGHVVLSGDASNVDLSKGTATTAQLDFTSGAVTTSQVIKFSFSYEVK